MAQSEPASLAYSGDDLAKVSEIAGGRALFSTEPNEIIQDWLGCSDHDAPLSCLPRSKD